MQQEAQRDAPDPRETRPPCYSEAIRMPRMDGSFASLKDFGKNRRNRKDDDHEDDEEEVPLRRNRCRSEEVLSMRSIIVPRVHPFEVTSTIESNRGTQIEPPSAEEIRNFNQSGNTLNESSNSPYSKRKKNNTASIQDGAGPSSRQTQPPVQPSPIAIRENHFNNSPVPSEGSSGSGDFVKIHIKKITEIPDDKQSGDGGGSRPTSI